MPISHISMFWSYFSKSFTNNEVHYGPDTPLLPLTHRSKLSISAFLQIYCPAVYPAYRPSTWLQKYSIPFPPSPIAIAIAIAIAVADYAPSGHLQTIYLTVGDFSKQDNVEYERWCFVEFLAHFLLIPPQTVHPPPRRWHSR